VEAIVSGNIGSHDKKSPLMASTHAPFLLLNSSFIDMFKKGAATERWIL
jgi:hypothetical protein